LGGRGRQADAGGGRGGVGDRKEEERTQQGNTWEEGGHGLEPLSAGPGVDKEGAGENARAVWANAFRA
jgi:hypothetical protein